MSANKIPTVPELEQRGSFFQVELTSNQGLITSTSLIPVTGISFTLPAGRYELVYHAASRLDCISSGPRFVLNSFALWVGGSELVGSKKDLSTSLSTGFTINQSASFSKIIEVTNNTTVELRVSGDSNANSQVTVLGTSVAGSPGGTILYAKKIGEVA